MPTAFPDTSVTNVNARPYGQAPYNYALPAPFPEQAVSEAWLPVTQGSSKDTLQADSFQTESVSGQEPQASSWPSFSWNTLKTELKDGDPAAWGGVSTAAVIGGILLNLLAKARRDAKAEPAQSPTSENNVEPTLKKKSSGGGGGGGGGGSYTPAVNQSSNNGFHHGRSRPDRRAPDIGGGRVGRTGRPRYRKQDVLKELFPNGIENLHFRQRYSGNCYLVGGAFVLSRNPYGKKVIENLIRKISKDEWQVTYPGNRPITVKRNELNRQRKVYDDGFAENFLLSEPIEGNIGVQILERAQGRVRKAEFRAQGIDAVTMEAAASGGSGHEALELLTGWPSQFYVVTDDKALANHLNEVRDELHAAFTSRRDVERLLKHLMSNQRNILTIHTRKVCDEKLFEPSHLYGIVEVTDKTVLLVNPRKDTRQTIAVTYDELFENTALIGGVRVPNSVYL